MGLFSDIISSIGNAASDVFGSGGNDDQKKKQQQQSAPNPVASRAVSPVKLPAVFQAAQQNQQNNPLHITPIGGNQQPPNPLAPQGPQTPAAPQISTQNYGAPAAHSSGPSLASKLLHGGVSVVKSVAQPFVNTGEDVSNGIGNGEVELAHALGVHAGQTESNQQQFGNINNAVGLKTEANTPKNFALNTAQVAGTVLAPGADAGAEVAAQTALNPEAANTAVQLARMGLHQASDDALNGGLKSAVINTGAKVGANAAIGGGFNAANGIEQGESGKDVLKDFGTGAAFGGALGGASGVAPIIKGIRGADDAGVPGDESPVESGTKSPGTAANAPSSEKAAPAEKAPDAVETGVKPAAAPEVAEAPAQPAVAGKPFPEPQVVPTLEKTGNDEQDLHNATGLVKNLLENGRDYSGATGKNALQQVLDLANSHLHSNNVVSSALNNRLAATLNDGEARNVRNAIETGSTKGLSDKEANVVKSIQENIEGPSNATRSNLSKDYQQADNHFPQVRNTGVKDAVKGAAKAKGLSGKINTFDDLLNQNSRFSEGSSLGTFTRGSKSVTGDANDLGLVAKKNGTFVDKAGKVYQYSRATSQDLENAGSKIQAPKDALTAYVRDTLNLKTRADAADYLIKNSDGLGLHDTQAPGAAEPVSIKGSDGEEHSFFTDKKTAQGIKDSGILGNLSKETNLPTKAWNALSSIIAQGTVVNPFAHGLNLATNAAVGSGERANGITGLSTLVRGLKPIDEATELRMSDAGVHFPTYGKDTVTAISKATGGLSKLNETAVATIDKQARSGMFENLTKGGMSDKEAADTINKWMGGRSVYKSDNAQLGLFWKYFVRQNQNAGRLLTQAAKGHPGALINAAIAAGGTFAADKGLQAVTGNQQAYIHAPGVVGVGNDIIKTADQIKNKQGQQLAINNPLVTHLNPIIPTAAEQILGVNEYGDKFANGSARLSNLEGITPESNLIDNNGHSAAEKGLNTFGIYTPHVKGNMATDNPTLAPALNVKGAQNGSTVAFPKDFTGEQEQNEVNKLGNNYSTKSAAILGTQDQNQQQKFVQATNTLKKYGITDTADVQSFSKLSTKDQGSYVDAVDALNKSGTSISSSSVQSQLVKNGDTELAANLNKNIPGSLPQDEKNSLETYSTLGSDGQKGVWLQNNDNADSYYKSVIDQKQAQGALTTDDTDVSAEWSGSGNSLYVKALVAQTNKQNNVPQSTVELYKNTTKTEYNDMSGSQKATLTAYAQQLNASGVTDKYGLATGSSGSSGYSSSSGSSAYSKDLAAGLPYGTISESFVKPTTDTGLKSSPAKTYSAPKLLKYTPDEKSNPFVRSISVKAGVK